MQNEELLTVRDILDDDYGCEELPLGAEPMVTVILTDDHGAGGSTKMVEPGTNHIERVFNLKYPKEYTERPEKGLSNQAAFAAFYRKLGL